MQYRDGVLHIDQVPLTRIADEVQTPTYIYSLRRLLENYRRIKTAFAALDAEIHYSAKANANLAVLRTLIEVGAGIDAVSGGEIYCALAAGADPQQIVFAGTGKTPAEIHYAMEQAVGWFNVENVGELELIQEAAVQSNRDGVRVALRLNPGVTASTHPYIATGHGGAKFGLDAETVRGLLARRTAFDRLRFAGIHVHIGSQLGDTRATRSAVQKALHLIQAFPDASLDTLNIGGGFPVAYDPARHVPSVEAFAAEIRPLLQGYRVLLEPGRSIVADAGVLLARVLYVKRQGGQTFYITDASMAELIRPALYDASHLIVPVQQPVGPQNPVQVVGPVCETADVLGRDIPLPALQPGDLLAILKTGAYGMVMASRYNARPRPAEVVIQPDGQQMRVARRRETWADLIEHEG